VARVATPTHSIPTRSTPALGPARILTPALGWSDVSDRGLPGRGFADLLDQMVPGVGLARLLSGVDTERLSGWRCCVPGRG